jgi:hypothetical protein
VSLLFPVKVSLPPCLRYFSFSSIGNIYVHLSYTPSPFISEARR